MNPAHRFSAPPPSPLADEFWRSLADGRLRLPRCSATGRWLWYPDPMGLAPGAEVVWEEVPGTGRVATHTEVHRSFYPGAAVEVPYVVVLVDLDGAPGVRLAGPWGSSTPPSVGQAVRFALDRPVRTMPPEVIPVGGEEQR